MPPNNSHVAYSDLPSNPLLGETEGAPFDHLCGPLATPIGGSSSALGNAELNYAFETLLGVPFGQNGRNIRWQFV